ncbi:MAG: hypothetical protein D6747_03435 [Chlorobiota bacterium]|nr:MAG: hypothetical protein D6747_03435 [Chlorobiota bacterium]
MEGRMLQRFLLCVFAASVAVALQADEDVLRPKGRPESWTGPPSRGLIRNPWALGIEVGGSLSLFGQDVTQYQAPTYQSNLTRGSGFGPLLNLAVDYALTDALGIQARLGYDQKHFTTSGYLDSPCETPPGSGFFIPTRVEHTRSQTIAYWTGGIALRYRFEENWVVLAGITYHSRSNASFTETDSITSSTCQFYDDAGFPIGQRRQESGSNTSAFNAARWSLDLSVGYRIPLSENIVFLPRLAGQIFLNPITGDNLSSGYHPVLGQIYAFTNRRLHALQLVLGVWFNL